MNNLQLGWGEGNATVSCCPPDARPAVVVSASTGVVFDGLKARRDAVIGPGYDVGLRDADDTKMIRSHGIVVKRLPAAVIVPASSCRFVQGGVSPRHWPLRFLPW